MPEKAWPTKKQNDDGLLPFVLRLAGSILYVIVFLFWLLTLPVWVLYGWRRWKKTGDWYQFHRGMMRPLWFIQSILHQDWAG